MMMYQYPNPLRTQYYKELEDRLHAIDADGIRFKRGNWGVYGPYTNTITGETIEEAIFNAEKALRRQEE